MNNIEAVQKAMDMLYDYCEENGIGLQATIVFYIDGKTMVEQVNSTMEEDNY